ncbi:hypothetical protein Taro_034558 [Colocasia esculenta]|uniref:J domain-containing protein n=1 Tax=Colocasia esculenta TaxID=4460 RepID=A0A843W4B9_COLES|nr:hypothetical protein [Colocasia esculenta]
MAAGGEQGKPGGDGFGVNADLYAVLGLKKECSAADLRSAYKKLALRWHPDRCLASGSSKTVDEAKTKFQAIQGAYSVLSDTNKRFLYDVGVYDDDDDDDDAAAAADGMGDFLGEMAAMMSQANHNPCESGSETFEQLQELFVEMFQADMDAFCGGGGGEATATTSSRVQGGGDGRGRPPTSSTNWFSSTSDTAASFYGSCRAPSGGGLKRDNADMCSGKAEGVAAATEGAGGLGPGSAFCFGTNDQNGSSTAAARGRPAAYNNGKRRSGRKPKASSWQGDPSPPVGGEMPSTE